MIAVADTAMLHVGATADVERPEVQSRKPRRTRASLLRAQACQATRVTSRHSIRIVCVTLRPGSSYQVEHPYRTYVCHHSVESVRSPSSR